MSSYPPQAWQLTKGIAMKRLQIPQPDLFEQISILESLPLPTALHQSVIVQLAQLMRVVVEAIDKEVVDEQD
jgi:hypothetical protein